MTSYPDDLETIAAELQYVGEHQEMFTKDEMATLLKQAAGTIRDFKVFVGGDLDLELLAPRGSA